jgi:hypothetical protein
VDVLFSQHFNRNNTHARTHFALLSVIAYIRRALWDFFPFQGMYHVTYKYTFATVIMNVSFTLLNIETKKINKGQT